MTKYLLVLVLMMSGCASVDTDHFNRVTERAIKYGVPLYYGIPPAGYSYRDLGPVAGVYSVELFKDPIDSSFNALKDMSIHARGKGANAVIEVQSMPAGFMKFGFLGEAVDFDTLPPDK